MLSSAPAYVAGSVLGSGYVLNRQGKTDRTTVNPLVDAITPHNRDIYATNIMDMTYGSEITRVDKYFTDARDGIRSNVIAPEFNHEILNNQSTPIKYLQTPSPDYGISEKETIVSKLAGVSLPKGQFVHNNMVPFFGSRVKQNTYEYANRSLLEKHTGVEMFSTTKKETAPFFEPTKQFAGIRGSPDVNETLMNYTIPNMFRQNELPFDQTRVGPGLNKGFTALPSGGFQQAETRDYALPLSVDELRVKTNPKLSFHGRIVPGKSVSDKREVIGDVKQYKPDTFYEQESDRYLVTTGAVLKPEERPTFIVKDTNRKTSKAYSGPAAPADVKNPMSRPEFKKSTRINYEKDGPRNAYHDGIWSDIDFNDYGKGGYDLPANERDITAERTHTTNLTTMVKALIAPLFDVFRTTIKETNIHDTRTGNIEGMTSKGPVIDKETMTFRTTIKETNIHDTRTGNIEGMTSKGPVIDKETMTFKTTTKELTEDKTVLGSLSGPKRLRVYDPNDVARTTTKETTLQETPNGNMRVVKGEYGYLTNPQEAPNTNRQFTSDYEYTGIADDRTGRGTGYLTNPQEAPNTNKQFTSDYEYMGTAESKDKAPMSYENMYNARTNIVKEGTLVGREPTPNNVKLWNGKESVKIDYKKIDGDYINTYQPGVSRIVNSINGTPECAVTKQGQLYDNDKIGVDRIAPDLLDAFNSNPYTQPLSSYGYT